MMMKDGKGIEGETLLDGQRDGSYGRKGSRQRTDKEATEGNCLGRGEGALGGQAREGLK